MQNTYADTEATNDYLQAETAVSLNKYMTDEASGEMPTLPPSA